MNYRKMLYASAVVLAAIFYSISVNAAPIYETRTVTRPVQEPNIEIIPFSRFDLNNDGVLSAAEAGENLFYLFDADGNQVLDNIEWEREIVYTTVPVQKDTYVYLDTNGDGEFDTKQFDTQRLELTTALSKFDEDNGGLSPRKFSDSSFLEADLNRDKVVDIGEWRATYLTDSERRIMESAGVVVGSNTYGLIPDRAD